MGDTSFCARWFFGATVVLSALAYLFSGAGMLMVSTFWSPSVSESGEVNRALWLAVGLVLVFALSTIAVARWGAPTELWAVAAAWALLHVLRLADVGVFSYSGRELLGGYGEALLVLGSRFFEGSAFGSLPLYAVATVGYVAVALLGCRLGARWRARTGTAVDPAHTHA